MSLEDDIANPMIETINSMIANEQINVDHASVLMTILKYSIDEARFNLRAQIDDKIHLWESMYGERDKTLYALGLRHALDMINGEVATDKNGFNDKPYEEGQEFIIDAEEV
jgi:hypothetical protein